MNNFDLLSEKFQRRLEIIMWLWDRDTEITTDTIKFARAEMEE